MYRSGIIGLKLYCRSVMPPNSSITELSEAIVALAACGVLKRSTLQEAMSDSRGDVLISKTIFFDLLNFPEVALR